MATTAPVDVQNELSQARAQLIAICNPEEREKMIIRQWLRVKLLERRQNQARPA
jgi:hypothetical protein